MPLPWNDGMMEYWNVDFKFEIFQTPHCPKTHYSTIPLFHHSNSERSELTWRPSPRCRIFGMPGIFT